MATKNKKNETINTSVTNALRFTTYKGSKEGAKTIPVVYGFTGKDDERLAYIANMEPAPKAKNGKKAPKKEPGYAHCTYSNLAINGGDRIPCVIWGADPRWVEVAKYTAEVINDLNNLTQEQYDKLGDMAAAVYEAIKAEGKAKDAEKKAAKPTAKPAAKKTEKPAPEVTTESSKPAAKGKKGKPTTSDTPIYTHADLEATIRNAFGALAKRMKWDSSMFEPLIESALNAAKTNVKRKAA